jgi:hypothetical protein
MKLDRGAIFILLSLAILASGVAFNYFKKREFLDSFKQFQTIKREIAYIKKAQKVWNTKGITKKIHMALKRIPSAKKSILLKRKKVQIKLKNLNSKSLNYALGRLASLPLQFRDLKIKKVGENFNLECLCVW